MIGGRATEIPAKAPSSAKCPTKIPSSTLFAPSKIIAITAGHERSKITFHKFPFKINSFCFSFSIL
jgi:hypothetical protein